jgi:hypothetical protein
LKIDGLADTCKPTRGVSCIRLLSAPVLQSWALRQRKPLEPKERELIPVPALEHDFTVNDMEEAAASQAKWITPFEDGPLTVLEDVLHDTHHIGLSEFGCKHPPDGLAAYHGLLGHLMIRGILTVEVRQGVDIAAIKSINPCLD